MTAARAAGLLPLWGLTKRQGAALLQELGAPESTWAKVPTADLEDDRPGLADEEALGVTYAAIDAYLEGREVSPKDRERIEYWWRRSTHKRHLPATPADTWWREQGRGWCQSRAKAAAGLDPAYFPSTSSAFSAASASAAP